MANSRKWWNPFNILKETWIYSRYVTKRSVHHGFDRSRDFLKGFIDLIVRPSVGGRKVTETTALGLSSVYRCVSLISQAIGTMPINKFTETDGNKTAVFGPVPNLLKRQPNANMIAFTYNELLFSAALLWGNGYAYIVRDGNATPNELIPVHPEDVRPFFIGEFLDREIWYQIKIDKESFIVPGRDMIHIRGLGTDELHGISVLSFFNQNIGIALAADQYQADFYDNGTILQGVIETAGTLDETALKKLRSNWIDTHNQVGGNRTGVLDIGQKYVPIGLPPKDAQAFETRTFQKKEIATWFGVPLHLLNEDDKQSKGTVEQNSMEFVRYGLMPWIIKTQQEYWSKLLTEREKRSGNVTWKFNVNSLLRADFQTRMEGYTKALNFGWMSRDEVRELEDMNKIPNGTGQLRFVPLQSVADNLAEPFYGSQIKENNDGQQD